MHPSKKIVLTLSHLVDQDHYLFTLLDLQSILPHYDRQQLKMIAHRIVKSGFLKRVCRGLYLYPHANYPRGLVLYHAAARLRASEFNYLSLESTLSDAGVISQIPMNWITLMSSGRSHIVDCGDFGKIEFIHTQRLFNKPTPELAYDSQCHLWRASVKLALQDMKLTHRKKDLINWKAAHELV